MQVTGQLGVVPRHEVQLPQEDVDTETEAACRASQEALELEQALAGEKDFNPWAWTRHRLVCAKGYKPWFGQLFTKDQQEMRYRDIHSDLRVIDLPGAREWLQPDESRSTIRMLVPGCVRMINIG